MSGDGVERYFDYFQDETIDDVVLQGCGSTFALKNQTFIPLDSARQENLIRMMQEFCFVRGVRLDPLKPSAGGVVSWNDTYLRWHCIIPPKSTEGGLFALRRLRFGTIEIDDFIMPDHFRHSLESNVFNSDIFLCVGPTGSGKSTLLMCILKAYFLQKRVFILEDIPELSSLSPLWGRLSCGGGRVAQSLMELLKESLRMRPDHIVFGEIRTQNDADCLKEAAQSGHCPVLATVHAQSKAEVFDRFFGDWPSHLLIKGVVMSRGDPPKLMQIID